MVRNCQKLSKLSKKFKSRQNCLKLSNIFKLLKIVENCQKMSKIVKMLVRSCFLITLIKYLKSHSQNLKCFQKSENFTNI